MKSEFQNIKCIFLDIDNTLTNESKEITSYTREVLSELKDLNIYTIVCTGRTNLYAIQKSKDANCTSIVIADNGALIYDYENNISIYENEIMKSILKIIWNYSLKYKIDCVFNTPNARYRSTLFKDNEYIQNAFLINSLDEITENVTQIVVNDKNHDKMKDFIKFVVDIADVEISNTNIKNDNSLEKSYFCDINLKGTSKGYAVNKIKEYLKFNYDDTMAFGDSANDLPLFENVNISVAMKNSSDDIKKKTKFVTEYSNNEDGVAKFIEKYIIRGCENNGKRTKFDEY